jgi:hypothetical protein
MGNLFEILPLELIDMICEKINIEILMEIIKYMDELPLLEVDKPLIWDSIYRDIFHNLNDKRLSCIKRKSKVIKIVTRYPGLISTRYCFG